MVRPLILFCVSLCISSVQAQTVVPADGAISVAGGGFELGCTDMLVQGLVSSGDGGTISGILNLAVIGGVLNLNGGSGSFAQQFTNQGTVTDAGGSLSRVGSAGCPASGPVGRIFINGQPSVPVATPVPSLQGFALGFLTLALGVIGAMRARKHAV